MLLDSPSSSHEGWRVHGANWIGGLDSSEARGTPPRTLPTFQSLEFVPIPAHLSGKVPP